jgi:transmembrane sensor
MSMTPINPELLTRYLSGDVSPSECERVEEWLAEDPERWARLALLRDRLADAALDERAITQARMEVWARLEEELGHLGAGSEWSRRPTPATAPGRARPVQRVGLKRMQAAGLLVALASAAVVGAILLRWRPPAPAPPVRVAQTSPGERAMLHLPDGTRVLLGVASTLRYPTSFASGAREVSIDGEAYFEVVHDVHRPFTVRARDLVATDLGTAFAVRAYPEDSGARVVVRQGRVSVRGDGARSTAQVVAPGQLGRLGPDRQAIVETADTATWFAWTEGRLVFDGTPLREALPQLSRWFNIEFRLADSALGDVPLSATLRTQPTDLELNNLAMSLGLKQRRTGRIVTLFSDPSAH